LAGVAESLPQRGAACDLLFLDGGRQARERAREQLGGGLVIGELREQRGVDRDRLGVARIEIVGRRQSLASDRLVADGGLERGRFAQPSCALGGGRSVLEE